MSFGESRQKKFDPHFFQPQVGDGEEEEEVPRHTHFEVQPNLTPCNFSVSPLLWLDLISPIFTRQKEREKSISASFSAFNGAILISAFSPQRKKEAENFFIILSSHVSVKFYLLKLKLFSQCECVCVLPFLDLWPWRSFFPLFRCCRVKKIPLLILTSLENTRVSLLRLSLTFFLAAAWIFMSGEQNKARDFVRISLYLPTYLSREAVKNRSELNFV